MFSRKKEKTERNNFNSLSYAETSFVIKVSSGKFEFATMRFWLDFRRNFIIIHGFRKDYGVLFCKENDSEQRRQTSVSGSWETFCAVKGLEILLGFLQQCLSVDFIAMESTCYVL